MLIYIFLLNPIMVVFYTNGALSLIGDTLPDSERGVGGFGSTGIAAKG